MEIEVFPNSENNEIVLKKVFTPIYFKTEEGYTLSVCMKDDGYEIGFITDNSNYRIITIKKTGVEEYISSQLRL